MSFIPFFILSPFFIVCKYHIWQGSDIIGIMYPYPLSHVYKFFKQQSRIQIHHNIPMELKDWKRLNEEVTYLRVCFGGNSLWRRSAALRFFALRSINEKGEGRKKSTKTVLTAYIIQWAHISILNTFINSSTINQFSQEESFLRNRNFFSFCTDMHFVKIKNNIQR